MYIARFVKSLESFEWALANGLTFPKYRQGHITLTHAVKAANVDVIKRVMAALREANPDFRLHNKDWNSFRHRAWLTNQVEVMEWVVTNGTFDKDSKEKLSQDDILRHHVNWGNLPMLKWWFEKYGASDIILSKRQFAKAAASHGELEVLKWLVENGFKFSADCLAAAAQGGALECIEYLREIGCPWSNKVAKINMVAGAALWLPKPGHFNFDTYNPVAVEKYVQVLRYLMETGCPRLAARMTPYLC